jgi:hypothetical protein
MYFDIGGLGAWVTACWDLSMGLWFHPSIDACTDSERGVLLLVYIGSVDGVRELDLGWLGVEMAGQAWFGRVGGYHVL